MMVFDLRGDSKAVDKLWSHMQATWKNNKTVWKMRWNKANGCFAVFGNGTAYLI